MSTHNNPPQSWSEYDSRLQFLLQSSESLHANLQELHERMSETDKRTAERNALIDSRIERLLTIVEAHQRRLDDLEEGSKQ